jgi:hypothetical protein
MLIQRSVSVTIFLFGGRYPGQDARCGLRPTTGCVRNSLFLIGLWSALRSNLAKN